MLVAISIPIFSAQLEKSREATDLANIRATYAELAVQVLDNGAGVDSDVKLSQREDGWKVSEHTVAGVDIPAGSVTSLGTINVSVDADGDVTFTKK